MGGKNAVMAARWRERRWQPGRDGLQGRPKCSGVPSCQENLGCINLFIVIKQIVAYVVHICTRIRHGATVWLRRPRRRNRYLC